MSSDTFRAQPAFDGVQRHDAQRLSILPGENVRDDGSFVGLRFVRLAIGAAKRTEIVKHDVNGDIVLRHKGDVLLPEHGGVEP